MKHEQGEDRIGRPHNIHPTLAYQRLRIVAGAAYAPIVINLLRLPIVQFLDFCLATLEYVGEAREHSGDHLQCWLLLRMVFILLTQRESVSAA
jgi:hypothetical protein